jgi:diguanylate cyclase (GGDEF)-like protein
VRQILLDEAALVLDDRVASPREILTHLETTMQIALDVDSVRFVPIEGAPGEFWTNEDLQGLPHLEGGLRILARERNALLYVRDLRSLATEAPDGSQPQGSALFLGIGDDGLGWRGVLEARDRRREHFSPERMTLACLLAEHFETVLASAVRLQSLIFQEPLTGLYNRVYFEDQLERQLVLARRHGQSLGLFILDIDDFKGFNTHYGYEGGDRVLTTVGSLLKTSLRTSDTLARYGGEEFTLLLAPPVQRDEARVIAERLRATVEDHPFHVQTLDGHYALERITLSLGGAMYPEDGEDGRSVWNVANRRLLDAKKEGKNRVRL